MTCLSCPDLWAQRNFDQSKEIGLAIGTGYYMGDINPGTHLAGRLSAGYGGYYRHNFSSRLSLRVNYFKGRVEAWDEDSRDPWQINRNLHFRNDISELSALIEINYLDHQVGNLGDKLTAFLFTGLGVYNHMPEAQLEGQWTPLQPLGTEGQGTTWAEARGSGCLRDFRDFNAHRVWFQVQFGSVHYVLFRLGCAQDVDGLPR